MQRWTRRPSLFLLAAGVAVFSLAFAHPAQAQSTNNAANPLTINTTNPADWIISNGAITIDFNTQAGNIFELFFPEGSTNNIVDQTQTDAAGPKGFYMDNSGFGSVPGVPGYVNTGRYLDWWVTYPSSSTNAFTYSEHWVVTPNDPGFHVYFVADHATTDITGSIGQVQWVLRENLNEFTNTYEVNEDLSNPGPVLLGPLPTYAEFFGTVNPDGEGAADPGRAIQCATVDMHGYGEGPWAAFPPISPGFGREFGDKYDYSGYNYLNLAHGVFGSQYGAWVVFPSNESTVGGPTKQNLIFTGNLDMIEAFSNHLDNDITLTTPSGTASHRLFGPFYVRFNKIGGDIRTPYDMYQDAVTAGTPFRSFHYDPVKRNFFRGPKNAGDDFFWGDSGDGGADVTRFSDLYDHEAQLLAAGYVPSTARGSVQVQVRGVDGNPETAWAVLGDQGTNFQYSSHGAQYWADISRGGVATFHGVIPGTYRLSVYDLGRWGEFRKDGIAVTADQTTVVPVVNFVHESFGAAPPVFNIGIPDRSSHEFLHGHDAQGRDNRQYWGDWNYWADFAANQGAVVYYATRVGSTPATNDLSKWNYNQWQTFDPGLFGGYYNVSDDTTDGYKYIVPSYVTSLSEDTPPWQIHFTTTAEQQAQGQYVVLSLGLAATEADVIAELNGANELIWHGVSIKASDASVRSGLAGTYQWLVLQWNTSQLNPPGEDNVITLSVNRQEGVMYDALRLEISPTSADQTVTGWNDYEYVNASTYEPANDTVANP